MKILLAVLMLALVTGCGVKDEDGKKKSVKQVANETVKTMSGYNQIKAGQKAGQKIKDLDKKHQKQMEAMGVN